MSNRKQSETDVGQSAYKEAAARETLMQTLSKTSAQNSGIRIVNPAPEHYDAFVKACGQMRAYVNDPSIPDDIGKKESKGFIFARDEFANLTKADFETKVVDNYRKKEEKDAEKPEYFRFIMDGNTIVGSVNARAMKMDDFDIKNGLEPYREWSHISEKGAKITTSTLILPEHRGKGIIGQAEKLFFDELKSKGIDEITSTVLSENDGSNRAQKKLIEKFGGKSYQIHGDPDGKGVRHYNRYVIRTDTTGKDKTKYNEQTAVDADVERYRRQTANANDRSANTGARKKRRTVTFFNIFENQFPAVSFFRCLGWARATLSFNNLVRLSVGFIRQNGYTRQVRRDSTDDLISNLMRFL